MAPALPETDSVGAGLFYQASSSTVTSYLVLRDVNMLAVKGGKMKRHGCIVRNTLVFVDILYVHLSLSHWLAANLLMKPCFTVVSITILEQIRLPVHRP